MRPPAIALPVLLSAALAAGCAGPAADRAPAPARAADFEPLDLRQPAVFVRLTLDGPEAAEGERARLARDYEGALLEALDARAVLVRDVRVAAEREPRVEPRTAGVRAKEVGADHALLVDVRVARETVTVCRETGRPLRGPATVWRQDVEVVRAGDGATRLRAVDSAALAVTDVEIDCGDPRGARRRAPSETIREAVDRLLRRVLTP